MPTYNGTAVGETIVGDQAGAAADTINGLGGNDVLFGVQLNDILNGGDDDDQLYGGDGNDQMNGGNGNDRLEAGTGTDTLNGDDGNDLLFVSIGANTINGGAGSDLLHFDYINATSGITANFTNVWTGGTGSLAGGTVTAIEGFDYFGGTNFNDTVITGEFATASFYFGQGMYLNGGSDTATGGSLADSFHGGAGNDTLNGGGGNDILYGEADNDTLNGGDGDDLIYVDDGADAVNGGNGADLLYVDYVNSATGLTLDFTTVAAGGTGSLNGAAVTNIEGYQFFRGSNLGDTVKTGEFTTTNFYFGLGIFLENGNDSATGGGLADRFNGGNGDDTLSGGGGNDTLAGDAGNDTLNGGDGDDIIYVTDGADIVDGGTGVDLLDVDYINSATALTLDLTTVAAGGTGSLNGAAVTNVEGYQFFRGSNQNDTVATGEFTTTNFYFGLGIFLENGDDSATGGSLADRFNGGNGSDTLNGGGGNDTLGGDAGNDTLNGGGGDDIIYVTDGADTVDGGTGVDLLNLDYINSATALTLDLTTVAAGGTGSLNGAAVTNVEGYQYFRGSNLGDTVNTGEFSTTNFYFNLGIFLENGDDSATGGGLADRFNGGAGSDTLNGGGGNDILRGDAGNDFLIGGDGDDYFVVDDGADAVSGGAGTDTIEINYQNSAGALTLDFTNLWSGGTGTINGAAVTGLEALYYLGGSNLADSITTGNIATSTLYFNNGVNLFDGDDSATGGNLDDQFRGGNGNDTINGGGGNDILRGEAGNDTLNGGDGDDLFILDSGADSVTGGAGIDRLSIEYSPSASGVVVDLTGLWSGGTGFVNGGAITSVEGLYYVSGSNLADSITIGDIATNTLYFNSGILLQGGDDSGSGGKFADLFHGGSGNDTISGGLGNDLLLGEQDNDLLRGDGGNDTLAGGEGDDILEGGLGTDLLYGEAGSDIASYAAATARVIVNLGITTAQNTLGAGSDTLNSIENLAGSAFNDTLTGDANVNALTGGAGIDILNGLAGNDTLAGGDGNDTLAGGDGDDSLDGGIGSDIASYATATTAVTVSLAVAGAQNTLGAGSDTLTAIEGLTGSAFNDTLTGDANANTLNGGNGNDLISGDLGNDFIDGGSGVDTLDYALVGAGITLNLVSQSAQNTGGAGTDTVRGIENVIGTAFSDVLTGNEFGNIFTAGNGNDTLVGGLGNDTLDGGAGIDTANYATATAGVKVNLTILTAQSTIGAGGDTLAGIENLNGTGFDDQFTGDAGDNVLTGNGGNDTLLGGAGNDTLNGGAAIDTISYVGATAGVTVNLGVAIAQDTVGAGTDTLASIENLIGSALNDMLTGSIQINTISGGNGNDIIDGGSSNDTLDGGAGNDTLKGGTGNDLITGGTGNDSIDGGANSDTVSYAAAGSGVLVNLALTTAQAVLGGQGADTIVNVENVLGSAFGDTLTGSTLANVLTGGAGKDNLTGGAGNDSFAYLATGDSTPGANADRILDFAAGDILDLSAIDADATSADTNEAFTQVGAFSNVAGQFTLAFDGGANTTTLLGDTNGDSVADFSILFTGDVTALTGTWVL